MKQKQVLSYLVGWPIVSLSGIAVILGQILLVVVVSHVAPVLCLVFQQTTPPFESFATNPAGVEWLVCDPSLVTNSILFC